MAIKVPVMFAQDCDGVWSRVVVALAKKSWSVLFDISFTPNRS